MLKPHAYAFYSIAGHLRPLLTLKDGMPLSHNPPVIQLIAYARIGTILFTSDPFNEKHLPSSFSELKGLGEYIDEHVNKLPQYGPWDKDLDPTKVKAMQDILHSFETLLYDELQRLPLFCCEEEKLGNLSVHKLLAGASRGYPEATKRHLSPACSFEIDESGRCLVYERATAAGFHILRAVELAITTYLKAVPGFTMPPVNRQNWGEYISQLKAQNAGKGVIDHVQNLKDNHRNPLMHPQDTLDMPQATSLFGVCQGAIETIVVDGVGRGFLR